MAGRVRVRRLTSAERQRLQRIIRRGESKQGGNVIRWRRALMILASAAGNTVPVIARMVAADEDTVRDVIHQFNEVELDCLDPEWVRGRPRLLDPGDQEFVAAPARPGRRTAGRCRPTPRPVPGPRAGTARTPDQWPGAAAPSGAPSAGPPSARHPPPPDAGQGPRPVRRQTCRPAVP